MTMPPSGQWPPPPQGPPQYWGPPPPPPKGGKKTKWVLGGLGILVVVVVTVIATMFFTHHSVESAPGTIAASPTSPVNTAIVASANDRGPVALITDDPTCQAWTPIVETLVARLPQGWKDRDSSAASSTWTPDVHASYEAAATAMRSAADQTVPLVSKTPHRVMRELYAQTIAYWRAYADVTSNYEPTDNYLANASTTASNALVWICDAMTSGSAAARSLLIPPTTPPIDFAPIGDPARPERFLKEPSPACSDWSSTAEEFEAVSKDWVRTDPSLPVAQWSPEQQQVYAAISAPMSINANKLQDIALRSNNALFTDFADLAALYRKAFVQSFPTYVPPDAHLANSASQLVAFVNLACKAAGI